MSGFFKTIYIYICMFYFVAGDGAEKEKFFITYGDKQWYFTLDKATELGNKFYNLLMRNHLQLKLLCMRVPIMPKYRLILLVLVYQKKLLMKEDYQKKLAI